MAMLILKNLMEKQRAYEWGEGVFTLLSWFKKDKDTKWFDLETNNVKEIINYIVGVV